MFTAITPALGIVLIALLQADQPGQPLESAVGEFGEIATSAFGKTYTTYVKGDLVTGSLAWEEKDDCPPISPRKAIRAADKMCKSIVDTPDGWRWKVGSLNLFLGGENGGHCFWCVDYQAVPVEPKEGPIEIHQLILVILMDGTAIKPTVSDKVPEEKSPD